MDSTAKLEIALQVQIEFIGRVDALADGWAGRASGLGRIEGFTVTGNAPDWRQHVTCQAILTDGRAAPPVAGGLSCRTGRSHVPLHGFILNVAPEAFDLACITYEGMFQDGYRTGLLQPGSICASPNNAALLAMRINATPPADAFPHGAMARSPYPGEPPIRHVAGIVSPETPPETRAQPDDPWDEETAEVTLIAHFSGQGDTAAGADGWAGTPTGTNVIEGFTCMSGAPGWHLHLTYQAVQRDTSLGPFIAGGDYCGTTGKMLPIHGFVLHAPDDKPHLAGVFYEGAFADGFRSGPLRPGMVCASPAHAGLVAMRVGFRTDPAPHSGVARNGKEPSRMVIQDRHNIA